MQGRLELRLGSWSEPLCQWLVMGVATAVAPDGKKRTRLAAIGEWSCLDGRNRDRLVDGRCRGPLDGRGQVAPRRRLPQDPPLAPGGVREGGGDAPHVEHARGLRGGAVARWRSY